MQSNKSKSTPRERAGRAVAASADRQRAIAITPHRRKVFLDALRKTGSSYHAASVATPWASDSPGGGYTGFRDLRKRDPIFASEWAEAEAAFIGDVEAELARRVMTPHKRPIVSNGQVITHEEVPADGKLLMFLLERRDHTKWGKKVEVSGEVQHTHRHAHVGVTLAADDLYLLGESRRAQLLDILGELAEAKAALEASETPRAALPAPAAGRPFASPPGGETAPHGDE